MATESSIKNFSILTKRIFDEISKDVVGQKEVVKGAVIAMIAGGNVLLEGVPGVGKTRLVRTLGRVFNLPFSRIQFTPDLMPADVTGTDIVVEDEKGRANFCFKPGPVFSNIVLADEINRAAPKRPAAYYKRRVRARIVRTALVFEVSCFEVAAVVACINNHGVVIFAVLL